MKLRVDLEKCTGHGRCYDLAPALFDEDEAGHCVLLHPEVPVGLETQARAATENCPEEAILATE